MNRGEVKLKLVFDDDVFLEANYFVLFKSLDDREELKDTVTGLLCKLIEGKEEIFEGAVVEVDMQESDELFGIIGWEKRFCDLNEEEVIAITLILKRISEGLDDEYSSTDLTEIYFRYGGGRIGLTEQDIPF
jgi:hypothetical protein